MRIPSQFNQNSLYRRGTRRGENADTTRRLIRLMVGLVLLVVVMRQASKPAIYQTFFGESPSQTPSVAPQRTDQHTVVASPVRVAIDPDDRPIARMLTEPLRPSDQRQWLVALSRWKTGRTVEMVPSTVDTIRRLLNEDTKIAPQRRRIWLEMLDSFQQSVASAEEYPPTDIQQPPLESWLVALDLAAAARVVDGSTWRSGDFDTFYRYLDQAAAMSDESVATTGVLPLLQQPDVYRTQLVRIAGGVARAERMDAQENPFAVREYWQLWIRPSDGADRPLLAIVPDVPPLVAEVGPNASESEGPQVTLVGRFLKRLSYSSARGADLAPVVVGRLLLVPVAPSEIVAASGPATADSDFQRLVLTIVLASLIGITVAALAMWRTAVAARRAREIRGSHRKQPDLTGLGEQLPEESS